jgi:ABC-type lipoprotein export system ATPase subunit
MKQTKLQQMPLRYNKDKESVFHIDNLECSYSEGTVVLKAKDIKIPRNSVTILLGPSGSGKSTLLESLGLMSKTINSESTQLTFFPEPGQKGYPFEQLWDDKNKELLSKIRQDYFSFIFQSTNLMSNFTSIENVTLTDLIKSKDTVFANYKAINTLVEDLSILSLEYEKLPSGYSGGERQRIAFARAAIPEFSVLFGDEPTGNLDHFNSNKLMFFIQEFIRNHQNKSALIVSHNIDLALDFADRIIILTKNYEDASSSSTILEEFILDKDVINWDYNPELKKRIKKEIELLLNNEASHFVKLLSKLNSNNCPAEIYSQVKDKLIDWEIFRDETKLTFEKLRNSDLRKAEDNAAIKKNWEYISQLCFKGISVEPQEAIIINDLIKQFFDPSVPSYKDVIDRVISQIPDKNFADKVVSLFKSKKKVTRSEEAISRSSLLKTLAKPFRFLFWIIISLVPWINSLFENLQEFIKTKIFHISNNENQERTGWFVRIVKRFNDWVRKRFVRTCLAMDTLFTEFKLNKDQKTTINFKQSGNSEIIVSEVIHPHKILDRPRPFKKLFYKRESEKLLGNNNKNLWLILLILFLTFLAIGFSSGSLEYLEMKMKDPFIRSVSAKIPSTSETFSKAKKLIDAINQSDSIKQIYKIDTIVFYNTRTFHLKGDQPNSPKYGLDGRTVDLNDPLLSIIVDKKINEAVGHPFINDQDYSIIVTREALEKLVCSPNPSFLFKEVQYKDSLKYDVPIPIAAIVKSLPGYKTDYIISPNFYQHLSNLGDKFLFDPETIVLYSLIAMDSTYLPEFEKIVNDFFTKKPNGIEINSAPTIERMPYSYKSMYRMIVAFNNYDAITLQDLRKLFSTLKQDKSLVDFMQKAKIQDEDFVQAYYPNFSSDRKKPKYDVSFNFNDLSKVEAFAEYINTVEVKLEMSSIERMKNYNFVSKLTSLISILLIFFSVLMITLFLSNILRTHLNSIKMNIGTFKAFGIDIGHIYQRMMFMYIVLPLIAALGFCALVGYSGALYYLMQLVTTFDIEKYKYFNLLNYWTLGSIVVLLVVNYYTFSKIIKEIFSQTPGHLIYDRSNKA